MDNETEATPGGVKRKANMYNIRTPTPVQENRGGCLVKKGRGEPIQMESTDEEEPVVGGACAFKTYAEAALERAQIEAMKEAPPWARVILSAIKDNLTKLSTANTDLVNSLKFTNTRVKTLETDHTQVRTDVDDNKKCLDEMSLKFAKMQVEMKKLENRVIRQESQARKPNILFCGIPEDGADTWDDCRRKVDNAMLSMGLGQRVHDIRVDKVHRLGPPPRLPRGRFAARATDAPRPRPIIVSFNWNADRDKVWRSRSNLRDSGIHLEEDMPEEIKSRRYRLLPIFNKALTIDTYKSRTYLNGDHLTINGVTYTVDNLDKLPEDLDPRYLATRSEGDVTIFFGNNSPLSNHHPANFTVLDQLYTCSEQFYFASRATLLGDEQAHGRVMDASDPRDMLKHGRRARNLNDVTLADIEKEELVFMKQAIKEKFSQNPPLRAFLMATKHRIGEGSKSNPHWGTGLHLHHKNAFNTNYWATNHLGAILEQQKELFNS